MDPEKLKQEVKKLSDQLDFLNGEVGRVNKKLETNSEDLRSLELKKAQQQVVFDAEHTEQSKNLKKVVDQLILAGEKLGELKLEISKVNTELEAKKYTLLDTNTQIEKSILQKEALHKRLEEREAAIISFTKDLEAREKEIVVKEKEVDSKQKVLSEKEGMITKEFAELTMKKNEVTKQEARAKSITDTAAEVVRTYAGKSEEMDKREMALKGEKEALTKQKGEVENESLLNNRKEQGLKEREAALLTKETEFEKRESASIRRETDSILREAECRVREKALNIANREKQLDAQI